MTDPIIQDVLDNLPEDREARRIYLAKLAEESAEAAAELKQAAEERQKELDTHTLEELEAEITAAPIGSAERKRLVEAHRAKLAELAPAPVDNTAEVEERRAAAMAELRQLQMSGYQVTPEKTRRMAELRAELQVLSPGAGGRRYPGG